MHITPYQATRSPGTGAPISGAQLTGAEPFTLDVTRRPLPAALDPMNAQAMNNPLGRQMVDSLQISGEGNANSADGIANSAGDRRATLTPAVDSLQISGEGNANSADGIANSAGDRRATLTSAVDSLQTQGDSGSDDLKEAFHDFVGQTFFGEMIKSFRTTQQPSKYFNGGRAEEIFQGQFDQVLTEKLSDASSDKISDPMYELFMLKRSS